MNSPFDDHVSWDSAPVYSNATPVAREKPKFFLLWGDGVQVLQRNPQRSRVRARGRRRSGWVDNEALGGRSLLELYFIDVGQGDGILIKTPDFRHVMIDGGWPRRSQDTGKNAADFVDWKFYEDYAMEQIELEAMICSHIDQDHYGGLWDLLDVAQSSELDSSGACLKHFYHSGLAWWRKPETRSAKWLGPYARVDGETFFTQVMEDRDAVEAAIQEGATPQLAGEWKQFMECVAKARWTNNRPAAITRLSHATPALPEFETMSEDSPAIHVLGPVEFDVDGQSAIRRFSSTDSQNTNGVSVLLRIDYGRARFLLTGDLNKASQQALLRDYAGARQEFACDVAKACHHGSEDVSYSFLQAVHPAVTIVSSGDNEGHDHPRPNIVAASATTGFFQEHEDDLVSPLIYSTELARSVSFGRPVKLEEKDQNGAPVHDVTDQALGNSLIHYKETRAGDRNGRDGKRRLGNTLVVAGLIYGLVNVRTDGETILCATLDEKDNNWRIKKITSRF
jgi:beta-lactamase superfamily II metal-dependent hydrolase